MNEQDLKPNSHKYKEERREKKLEPVVKGVVKTKKRSEIRKFADVFISEDVSNVKSYVLLDVLVPAVKKAISDIVTNGIDMILYGETRRSSNKPKSEYVSYNKYSDRRDDRHYESRPRTGYGFDDIVLESRIEGENVLSCMDELIETYGTVTVADMYDLVGKSSSYTDNNYGWTNLRNAEVVRTRDGYVLKLPRVLPMK